MLSAVQSQLAHLAEIGFTVAGQLPIYTEFPHPDFIGTTTIGYGKERNAHLIYKMLVQKSSIIAEAQAQAQCLD